MFVETGCFQTQLRNAMMGTFNQTMDVIRFVRLRMDGKLLEIILKVNQFWKKYVGIPKWEESKNAMMGIQFQMMGVMG